MVVLCKKNYYKNVYFDSVILNIYYSVLFFGALSLKISMFYSFFTMAIQFTSFVFNLTN